MRVLILGPVINEKSSGGVAVFDEGLFSGFKELGDEVIILSLSKSSTIENIIVECENPNPNRMFLHFRKIAKEIKKYKPDIVISSLQYSLGIKQYKRHWPSATYIDVLHGFLCPINGRFKAFVANKLIKKSSKCFDKVVSVSSLTYAINKKMNCIVSDAIIYNGCSLKPSKNEAKRDIDFIYIGRLFKDKEVELIADAFIKIKKENPNLHLVVVGYGELESLFLKGKYSNGDIDFVGKLYHEQVQDYLSASKFFISMNSLEPFGIVFIEAIVNGCNVITQSTSGATAVFGKKDYFHFSDSVDADSLAESLLSIYPNYKDISNKERQKVADYMSYKRVASQYKELAKK